MASDLYDQNLRYVVPSSDNSSFPFDDITSGAVTTLKQADRSVRSVSSSPWLWAPHVAIGSLLVALMLVSFARFHCKYGHKYRTGSQTFGPTGRLAPQNAWTTEKKTVVQQSTSVSTTSNSRRVAIVLKPVSDVSAGSSGGQRVVDVALLMDGRLLTWSDEQITDETYNTSRGSSVSVDTSQVNADEVTTMSPRGSCDVSATVWTDVDVDLLATKYNGSDTTSTNDMLPSGTGWPSGWWSAANCSTPGRAELFPSLHRVPAGLYMKPTLASPELDDTQQLIDSTNNSIL